MALILEMLFVPAIALGLLFAVAIAYKLITGKPLIVVHSPESEVWLVSTNDVINDIESLDEIEGLWKLISVGRNGNFAPASVVEQSPVTVAIVGNTFTVTENLEMSTVELDASSFPAKLDQTSQVGDVHKCIARIRNGKLEICQGEVKASRPNNFNPIRTDGASLTMFEKMES